jgi:hypothetical protein
MIAFTPVLPSPETLPADAIPVTMDAKMRGAMMHFTPFKNIVLNGLMK